MNKLKVLLAIVFIAAGVVGFYMLPVEQNIARITLFIGGLTLAAVVLWFSSYGHTFIRYARESLKEAQKVAWPSRKETWQMTAIVFVFVLVLSLFMWFIDTMLSWVMYDLILSSK